MSQRRRCLSAALTLALFGLITQSAMADSTEPQLTKFIGCWMSAKAYGVMLTTDPFKEDGYSLSEEFVAVSIEPLEGEAFTNVVKGTLDIWSETNNYYIPTIYYGGVYDPIRDAIITDSTFYVVGNQLYFVHYRTTEKRSDRSFRVLDRVDCAKLKATRDKAQKTYKQSGG